MRCYQQHGFKVIPINKRQSEIEGLSCIDSLSALSKVSDVQAAQIGVSIITPPGVTQTIIQEGIQGGYKNFFLQPGTYDSNFDKFVDEMLRQNNVNDINIMKGCVLVELGFSPQEGEDF